jgi:hypothetical protein
MYSVLAVTPPKVRAGPLEVGQNVDQSTATSRTFNHPLNKIGHDCSYRDMAIFAKRGLKLSVALNKQAVQNNKTVTERFLLLL